jgi:hypothetical protein
MPRPQLKSSQVNRVKPKRPSAGPYWLISSGTSVLVWKCIHDMAPLRTCTSPRAALCGHPCVENKVTTHAILRRGVSALYVLWQSRRP